MAPLARGAWSEVTPAPPRPGVDLPLVTEGTYESFAPHATLLDSLEAEARHLAALGPPFRRVLEVTRTPVSVTLVAEQFIGLSVKELVQRLAEAGRVLPLPVWLAFADALTQVPDTSFGPAAGGGLQSLGVDVKRRLVVFPDPHLVFEGLHLDRLLPPGPRVGNLADFIPYISPEQAMGLPLTYASRVFSIAAVLAELLTTTSPFLRGSQFETARAISRGVFFWSAAAHPQCPPEVGMVLVRALHQEPHRRWPSLRALGEALVAAAGVPPVSMAEACAVALAIDFPRVQRRLRAVSQVPASLPEAWRNGGLEVFEDQLLELVPAPGHLPHRVIDA